MSEPLQNPGKLSSTAARRRGLLRKSRSQGSVLRTERSTVYVDQDAMAKPARSVNPVQSADRLTADESGRHPESDRSDEARPDRLPPVRQEPRPPIRSADQ